MLARCNSAGVVLQLPVGRRHIAQHLNHFIGALRQHPEGGKQFREICVSEMPEGAWHMSAAALLHLPSVDDAGGTGEVLETDCCCCCCCSCSAAAAAAAVRCCFRYCLPLEEALRL